MASALVEPVGGICRERAGTGAGMGTGTVEREALFGSRS